MITLEDINFERIFKEVKRCLPPTPSIKNWVDLLNVLNPLDFSIKRNLALLSYVMQNVKKFYFSREYNELTSCIRDLNPHLFLLCDIITISKTPISDKYLKNVSSFSATNPRISTSENRGCRDIVILQELPLLSQVFLSGSCKRVEFYNNPLLSEIEIYTTPFLEEVEIQGSPLLEKIKLFSCQQLSTVTLSGNTPHFKELALNHSKIPTVLSACLDGKIVVYNQL